MTISLSQPQGQTKFHVKGMLQRRATYYSLVFIST
jgi:hypothetical protein